MPLRYVFIIFACNDLYLLRTSSKKFWRLHIRWMPPARLDQSPSLLKHIWVSSLTHKTSKLSHYLNGCIRSHEIYNLELCQRCYCNIEGLSRVHLLRPLHPHWEMNLPRPSLCSLARPNCSISMHRCSINVPTCLLVSLSSIYAIYTRGGYASMQVCFLCSSIVSSANRKK